MNTRSLLALLAVLATACGSGDPTTAELVADPGAYEDRPVSLDGPVTFDGGCNAAACEELPCNQCWGSYILGDPSDPSASLPLVAADEWPFEARTPGPWDDGDCYGVAECEGGLPLGCNGNDLEMQCAPAVPARIVSVHGIVRRTDTGYELVVDDLELADAPHEETFEMPSWAPIRLFE